jgi:membrane fusion protein (multidrug efflux system)
MRARNQDPYSRILTARWTGAVAAALLAGLAWFSACSKDPTGRAAARPVSIAVRVARVEPQRLNETLDITGSLLSSVAVDVKTEFAGRVVSLLKQEGDQVSKGELLAQLEDVNARLSVQQARANLGVAQASLERAKVAEDHARTEQERAQNLLKSGGITDQDFQAAEMTARDARAQVKLAEAQVDQARQALAIAEKRLNDCRIISPITGEVERKPVNPGSWVDGNALLYRLVDNQRLELRTYVASSDLARVGKGQMISFSVATYPDELFDASILTIGAAIDSQNRSAAIRAAVPNTTGKLKSGMFVKGKIITGSKPAALVVPTDAVWRRVGQAPYVYIVEQNKARKREVQTGQEESQGIEITKGLSGGEQVIVEQNLELADGVNVIPRT